MARTLTAAMQTAISAKEGYADVWLIKIVTSNTTLYYSTAPSNVAWDSQSWIGIGGVIEFDRDGGPVRSESAAEFVRRRYGADHADPRLPATRSQLSPVLGADPDEHGVHRHRPD